MEIVFDFRKEESFVFGKILRPVAKVILINKDKQVPEFFYVDSGADVSLIPRSVGEILNLKMPSANEIVDMQGVTENNIPVVLRKIQMQLGQLKIETKIAWSMIENVPLLLGREGLFKYFEIIFSKNQRVIFKN